MLGLFSLEKKILRREVGNFRAGLKKILVYAGLDRDAIASSMV